VTPIFYKLRQNLSLSRQRSRVRAPSSPPYIPKEFSGMAETIEGAKGHKFVSLLCPFDVDSRPVPLLD